MVSVPCLIAVVASVAADDIVVDAASSAAVDVVASLPSVPHPVADS